MVQTKKLLLSVLIAGLCFLIIKFLDKIIHFHKNVSRKIVHCSIGFIYCISWTMFKQASKFEVFLLSMIPGFFAFYCFFFGSGGSRKFDIIGFVNLTMLNRISEMKQGTLVYAVVHVLITWMGFKKIPALVSICALCFGDGFACLMGERFGRKIFGKLPWSSHKTWVGLFSFFFFSMLSFFVLICLYSIFDDILWLEFLRNPFVPIIMIVSAITETISFRNYDNLLIPFVAMTLSFLLL
ncbi:farnesol kinase [Anaeramoeba flamelloides]|uniref:Farnesol kinase n=1 Tax=Anaeramoeba flamelloides TaxID=1746091 RepID=A0ABQ8YBD4_9EUKA|nr:farnesol kinase [Anaeramoeba flamelloides]